MENIQERTLRFITDDYVLSYEVLLINAGFTTIRARKMQIICIEIYKTASNLNPQYMRKLVEKNSSSYSTWRPKDLKIHRVNQVSYGMI